VKQVGTVSAKQFGYVYIDGIPFSPKKIKRFMSKGLGIKVQDIVIFDFEMIDGERVLNYIKNAIYAEEDESKMVKEFIKASELKRADSTISDGVSDQIKRDLAEEGLCITNDGVFLTPPNEPITQQEFRKMTEQPDLDGTLEKEAIPDFYNTEIPAEILAVLSNDERRTISIYLQSSLKAAIDGTDCEGEELQEEALKIVKWIDRNSTCILPRAEAYLKVGGK